MKNWIEADWPVPPGIHAAATLRSGGNSSAPYQSFNLAKHVNDKAEHVAANRKQLKASLQLPGDPVWLNQVHGDTVVKADQTDAGIEADAAYTHQANTVCAVMTRPECASRPGHQLGRVPATREIRILAEVPDVPQRVPLRGVLLRAESQAGAAIRRSVIRRRHSLHVSVRQLVRQEKPAWKSAAPQRVCDTERRLDVSVTTSRVSILRLRWSGRHQP